MHRREPPQAESAFDLGELSYQYPHERVVEGLTAQGAVEQLTETGAARMFPDGLPQAYRDQIAHELRLIGELGYAPFAAADAQEAVFSPEGLEPDVPLRTLQLSLRAHHPSSGALRKRLGVPIDLVAPVVGVGQRDQPTAACILSTVDRSARSQEGQPRELPVPFRDLRPGAEWHHFRRLTCCNRASGPPSSRAEREAPMADSISVPRNGSEFPTVPLS